MYFEIYFIEFNEEFFSQIITQYSLYIIPSLKKKSVSEISQIFILYFTLFKNGNRIKNFFYLKYKYKYFFYDKIFYFILKNV